jgi:hypothetical protein
LDDFLALSFTDPRTQLFAIFDGDAVSDWEGKIVVGVSLCGVCIAVGIASDDLDSELIELLEPFFCVG